MITRENRCCDCGLPCLGSDCPNKNVLVKYCDCCGCEVDTLYHYNGEHYCMDCIVDDLKEVEEDD